MSGIGLVLSTAKDALLTQQYAMDVTGHNIANVNTESYSRQSPVIEAKTPAPYGGLIFGRGVELQQIMRQGDTFVETRLRERQSDLSAMTEKETYMSVLEGVFNESSGRGLSSHFEEFWTSWHDLANDPSGSAERTIVYETGSSFARSLQELRHDVQQFEEELNLSIDAGVEKVNRLTAQVAKLNEQISNMEVTADANDLRDRRDEVIRELSEYMDIKVFQDAEGHMTLIANTGHTLVSKTESYNLGMDDDEIVWEGSGGNEVPVTDGIQGGKLGGWLEVRDEILPKYTAELDELASALIWEVNSIHTQGVGLKAMEEVSSTYAASDPEEPLASEDSGLAFYNRIRSGEFTITVYDQDGEPVGTSSISVDKDATKLKDDDDQEDSLVHIINDDENEISEYLEASVGSDGRLTLAAESGYSFSFSEDTSGVLAALGINTFFDGEDAADISVNQVLENDKELIAAGRVDDEGAFAPGDNTNALEMTELRERKVDLNRWRYERGQEPSATEVSDSLEGFYQYIVGDVGIKSQGIRREKEYNDVLVSQLNEQRDALSSVNLDEEMTNLIKFQHAYSAAAKLVSTADEMFETLLQMR
ncbi:MAG: flagellar hook-associated protein FlgK [Desulfobacteraceae bacterium]